MLGQVGSEGFERDIARLPRVVVTAHGRLERHVDGTLDVGPGAEAGSEGHTPGTGLLQHLVHTTVDADVGTSKAIDRLLWVADDEELARDWPDVTPIRRGWVLGS